MVRKHFNAEADREFGSFKYTGHVRKQILDDEDEDKDEGDNKGQVVGNMRSQSVVGGDVREDSLVSRVGDSPLKEKGVVSVSIHNLHDDEPNDMEADMDIVDEDDFDGEEEEEEDEYGDESDNEKEENNVNDGHDGSEVSLEKDGFVSKRQDAKPSGNHKLELGLNENREGIEGREESTKGHTSRNILQKEEEDDDDDNDMPFILKSKKKQRKVLSDEDEKQSGGETHAQSHKKEPKKDKRQADDVDEKRPTYSLPTGTDTISSKTDISPSTQANGMTPAQKKSAMETLSAEVGSFTSEYPSEELSSGNRTIDSSGGPKDKSDCNDIDTPPSIRGKSIEGEQTIDLFGQTEMLKINSNTQKGHSSKQDELNESDDDESYNPFDGAGEEQEEYSRKKGNRKELARGRSSAETKRNSRKDRDSLSPVPSTLKTKRKREVQCVQTSFPPNKLPDLFNQICSRLTQLERDCLRCYDVQTELINMSTDTEYMECQDPMTAIANKMFDDIRSNRMYLNILPDAEGEPTKVAKMREKYENFHNSKRETEKRGFMPMTHVWNEQMRERYAEALKKYFMKDRDMRRALEEARRGISQEEIIQYKSLLSRTGRISDLKERVKEYAVIVAKAEASRRKK